MPGILGKALFKDPARLGGCEKANRAFFQMLFNSPGDRIEVNPAISGERCVQTDNDALQGIFFLLSHAMPATGILPGALLFKAKPDRQ